MTDPLSPFARGIMTIGGVALSCMGGFMWLFGGILTLGMGIGAAVADLRFAGPAPLDMIGVTLGIGIGSIVLQAVGSAMYFFSQSVAGDNPLPVPTEWLPAWWAARFMRPLLVILAASFLSGLAIQGCRLSWVAPFHGLGLVAAIAGFRHFHRRMEELTPPYPPSGKPRPLHRGMPADGAD